MNLQSPAAKVAAGIDREGSGRAALREVIARAARHAREPAVPEDARRLKVQAYSRNGCTACHYSPTSIFFGIRKFCQHRE